MEKSKQRTEEETRKMLHELSTKLVVEARKKYSKTHIRDNPIVVKEIEPGREQDEKDTVYISSEDYNAYMGLLQEIKADFSIVENDGISIHYNSKKGMHTVDYGGNGLDYDNYWQAGVLFEDRVSEEEVQQRIEKEKKLEVLAVADQQLDAELSQEAEKEDKEKS